MCWCSWVALCFSYNFLLISPRKETCGGFVGFLLFTCLISCSWDANINEEKAKDKQFSILGRSKNDAKVKEEVVKMCRIVGLIIRSLNNCKKAKAEGKKNDSFLQTVLFRKEIIDSHQTRLYHASPLRIEIKGKDKTSQRSKMPVHPSHYQCF